MTIRCPNDHESIATDYCDQCGAKLQGAPAGPSAVEAGGPPGAGGASPPKGAPLSGAGHDCPNCQSSYRPDDKFCEVCGYDFLAGTLPAAPLPTPAGSAGGAGVVGTDPGVSSVAAGATQGAGSAGTVGAGVGPAVGEPPAVEVTGRPTGPVWQVSAGADRAFYDSTASNEMPFPEHCPERTFSLVSDEILIGRRSESRGIHPQIDLSGAPEDTGISRSHAVLRRQPDGTFALIDPGSTNGTLVNDDPHPIAHNVAVALKDGDRIYLGGWTKIVVHAPPPPTV